MANNQGGFLYPLDNVSHGEGLATAGNPKQSLLLVALLQPLNQLVYCLWLVSGKMKIGNDFEQCLFLINKLNFSYQLDIECWLLNTDC